jgi:hypothetical protein
MTVITNTAAEQNKSGFPVATDAYLHQHPKIQDPKLKAEARAADNVANERLELEL